MVLENVDDNEDKGIKVKKKKSVVKEEGKEIKEEFKVDEEDKNGKCDCKKVKCEKFVDENCEKNVNKSDSKDGDGEFRGEEVIKEEVKIDEEKCVEKKVRCVFKKVKSSEEVNFRESND